MSRIHAFVRIPAGHRLTSSAPAMELAIQNFKRAEQAANLDGVRESAQSWKDLLLDLKRRGLGVAPKLAVADGALGFWQAIEEVWPQSRGQRCWVHKTANVLNKLPKSQQSKAKRALQEIWMAETKKEACAALDVFVETWGVKLH
jgi:transposase-like protein